ncbi:MAG TPA: hypothetical protein VN249_00765, partial [Prolixibacteraceae bacterium]|nr:hypothetical protein [Prolixibacteraceae bacterium]
MKIRFYFIGTFLILCLVAGTGFVSAQTIDLSKCQIMASPKISSPVKETAIQMLQEEVAKRTSVKIPLTSGWGKFATIVLAIQNDTVLNGVPVPKRTGTGLPEYKSEGYRIVSEKMHGKDIIWIIGADSRGTLFGVGKFLRTAIMTHKKLSLDKPVDFAGSPYQSIRGHQLGYRNTNNSTDAWDVKKYEQYIRELVIFGTNSIETIPAGEKDQGVLMPIPPAEMNIQISKICAAYGIGHWIWMPATCDLKDQSLREKELEKDEQVFKSLPRLDDVFVPGGDP